MSALLGIAELTDRIIDHLHDDPAALRACALTSQAFVPAARHHLFVKIKVDATEARLNRLRDCLSCNPDLGRFVQSLTINLRSVSSTCIFALVSLMPALSTLHLHNLWISDSVSIPAIYPRVQDLYISGCTFNTIAQFLRTLLLFPTLRSCFIAHTNSLRNSDDEEILQIYSRDRIIVDTLEIHTTYYTRGISRLLSSHGPRIFHFLIRNNPQQEMEDLAYFCTVAGANLRELHLTIDTEEWVRNERVSRLLLAPRRVHG